MSRRRAASQAETRRRILDAAHEEFSTRRVADVSIDQVAARAGFTKGAVYSNFESKTDLLFAVLEQRMRERGADYIDLVAESSDAELGSAAGQRAGRTQADELGYFRLVASVWAVAVHEPVIGARLAELRRAHRNRLAEAIQARADGLGLELTFDPVNLATGLIGMSMAAMFDACIDAEVDVDEVHRTMIDLVLAGVLATSPVQPVDD